MKGFEESNAVRNVGEEETWYRIVDGKLFHEAILLLIEGCPDWKDFMWTVTIVDSGFKIERYWQLIRSQNLRQSPDFYVDSTFADILYNLRMEFDCLKSQKGGVTAAMVAEAFNGC